MKLPYVVDKQTHVLADILKGLLTEHKGRSLDVATAFFTVGGLSTQRKLFEFETAQRPMQDGWI